LVLQWSVVTIAFPRQRGRCRWGYQSFSNRGLPPEEDAGKIKRRIAETGRSKRQRSMRKNRIMRRSAFLALFFASAAVFAADLSYDRPKREPIAMRLR